MSSERVGQWLGNGLRSRVLARCAGDANDLKLVWLLANESRRQNAHQLGTLASPSGTVLGSTTFTEADLDDLAAREVAAWAGISVWQAGSLIAVADVLCTDLLATLGALAAGRLDLARARVVAEAVADLTPRQRLKVERVLLGKLPAQPLEVPDRAVRVGPWDAPAPRSWAQTVNRAVMRVKVRTPEEVSDAARAATGTDLRVHRDDPSLATFTVTGPTEDLVCLSDAVRAGARALPDEQRDGQTVGQVEVDLLCAAVSGDGIVRAGLRRELGLVIHLDTLAGDGPAADDPGEVRGASVGVPVAVDPGTARAIAARMTSRGAGTCLLLTDGHGHLQRVLRIGPAPENGWTRTTLVAAGRAALARAPGAQHETGSYRPTVEIEDLVRARDPVCTFPGCGVPAASCDLDHGVPHPRGPTSVINLSPRSRRCHRYKTAGLWTVTTTTDQHGNVRAHRWTSPLGAHQTVEVPPLPGHGPGEGYARTPHPGCGQPGHGDGRAA